MTVQQWLAVLLPGVTLDTGAISALIIECSQVYDLNAAAAAGYDKNKLLAMYVAAWLAPVAIGGVASTVKTLKSKKEGKVTETYGTEDTKKPAWESTTWGAAFSDIMDSLGGGGGIIIGHAE